MMKRTGVYLLLPLLAVWMMQACSDSEIELPDNPYDYVNYSDTTQEGYPLVPGSITDIHQRILEPKCANPGCHDGNFEPDFRTVQSSYATLIYHSVVKNNANDDFEYRVLPGDTAMSILYERITNCCFVNQNDRMPQDNIGVPLPEQDIADIAAWIVDSARDMYGEVPLRPDRKPYLRYWSVKSSDRKTNYNDKVDGLWYNPRWIPDTTEMLVEWRLDDDQTPVADFQNVRFKWSLDYADFSAGVEHTAEYSKHGNNEFWRFFFDPDTLIPDTNYYLRIYMNDGNHAADTEFPHDGLNQNHKTRYGFRIIP